jgi:hypothetical protein
LADSKMLTRPKIRAKANKFRNYRYALSP